MRRLLPALALTLLASGCDSDAPDAPTGIQTARIADVTVEALPLNLPWDSPTPGADPPDVYAEILGTASPQAGRSLARTEVIENLTTLPQRLRLTEPAERLSIRADLVLFVWDRDGRTSDDIMFRTDTLRLGAYVTPEDVVGGERAIRFEDAESRVAVRVRWE